MEVVQAITYLVRQYNRRQANVIKEPTVWRPTKAHRSLIHRQSTCVKLSKERTLKSFMFTERIARWDDGEVGPSINEGSHPTTPTLVMCKGPAEFERRNFSQQKSSSESVCSVSVPTEEKAGEDTPKAD